MQTLRRGLLPLMLSATIVTLHVPIAEAGPIGESLDKAIHLELSRQSSQRPAARGENPYLLPGLVLLGVGGSVLLIGLVNTTGVECSGTISSVSCGTKRSAAVMITGAAIAGVGGFLLMRGSQ